MQVEVIERKPTPVASSLRRSLRRADRRILADAGLSWMVTNGLLGQAKVWDQPRRSRGDRSNNADTMLDAKSRKLVATGNALRTVIPGGKYAALKYRAWFRVSARVGFAAALAPSSGLQLDSRPMFEYPLIHATIP